MKKLDFFKKTTLLFLATVYAHSAFATSQKTISKVEKEDTAQPQQEENHQATYRKRTIGFGIGPNWLKQHPESKKEFENFESGGKYQLWYSHRFNQWIGADIGASYAQNKKDYQFFKDQPDSKFSQKISQYGPFLSVGVYPFKNLENLRIGLSAAYMIHQIEWAKTFFIMPYKSTSKSLSGGADLRYDFNLSDSFSLGAKTEYWFHPTLTMTDLYENFAVQIPKSNTLSVSLIGQLRI